MFLVSHSASYGLSPHPTHIPHSTEGYISFLDFYSLNYFLSLLEDHADGDEQLKNSTLVYFQIALFFSVVPHQIV